VKQYVAIVILAAAVIAAAVSLAAKPAELPMKIDASSPGVWPNYASATRDPDIVCIHVLTPNVVRRRNGEENRT
jgi:hypothetical protein